MTSPREQARVLLGNIIAQATALVDTMDDETLPGHLVQIARRKVQADFIELMRLFKKQKQIPDKPLPLMPVTEVAQMLKVKGGGCDE